MFVLILGVTGRDHDSLISLFGKCNVTSAIQVALCVIVVWLAVCIVVVVLCVLLSYVYLLYYVGIAGFLL